MSTRNWSLVLLWLPNFIIFIMFFSKKRFNCDAYIWVSSGRLLIIHADLQLNLIGFVYPEPPTEQIVFNWSFMLEYQMFLMTVYMSTLVPHSASCLCLNNGTVTWNYWFCPTFRFLIVYSSYSSSILCTCSILTSCKDLFKP